MALRLPSACKRTSPTRASEAVWTNVIESALDQAEYVIALLTQGSYVSEICRAEQLRALRKNKCVIPVMAQSGADVPLHLEAKNYRDFTVETRYPQAFAELLSDLHARNGIKLKPEFRKTRYNTVPPLPVNFVVRPESLAALRDALITDGVSSQIAVTALKGMGGIGKTVLAQALCHDDVVQQAFPDGIIWIAVGKEARMDLARLREIGKALGDDLSCYDSDLAARNQYRNTIRGKASLIVVDDVWKASDLEPLRADDSPRSRLLFTTRDASIGRFVGAREHSARLMNAAHSRQLLASWAGLQPSELPAAAEALISACGNLPLALSVVGGMLRDASHKSWQDTLELLRNADLSAIEDQLPEGQQSFFKAVEVSFQSLKPEMQERYKALAVLLEDMAAPLPILQTLWNVDEPEARRTSRILADRSLAQRDSADESIRLHDLQLDFVRAQWPKADKEALDLIHGSIRLSSHVIGKDPGQFAAQVTGRLLLHQDEPGIGELLQRLRGNAARTCLWPLWPALDQAGSPIRRVLEGHTSSVNAVAISADGKRAVSGCLEGTLLVWDLDGYTPPRVLEGHTGSVNAVALSADGKRAVSGSDDCTLRVWDLDGHTPPRILESHAMAITAVALSADGRCAISGSVDGTLRVWDLDGHTPPRELAHSVLSFSSLLLLRSLTGERLARSVRAVALSADGKRAVSGSEDETLCVWDLDGDSPPRVLEGHTGEVHAVALSADGKRAVSGSDDRTLRVWDLDGLIAPRILKRQNQWVTAVALSADGKRAVSVTVYKTLCVWDLDGDSPPRVIESRASSVRAIALSADGKRVVSGSNDRMLRVWNLDEHSLPQDLEGHTDQVDAVALSSDGMRAVSGSKDNTLRVWDLDGHSAPRILEGHSEWVTTVALSADGRRAFSGSVSGRLCVWDLDRHTPPRIFSGHTEWVTAVALSADGKRAISGSKDKTLHVWDVDGHASPRVLEGHTDEVTAVALGADGKRAVSGSLDGTLRVWDLDGYTPPRVPEGHAGFVRAVALSADGKCAVSASLDGMLRVWDLDGQSPPRVLEGHTGWINAVALSADGKRAVSGSQDNTLRVWNLNRGVCEAVFACDTVVLCCSWRGEHVIAGDEGWRVHLLRWLE
jgi:WD40 repeat protein